MVTALALDHIEELNTELFLSLGQRRRDDRRTSALGCESGPFVHKLRAPLEEVTHQWILTSFSRGIGLGPRV